ncbi:MAG TPA: hypothetical protein VKL40_01525 [Candidatus Angelobacter sp.]|nr:hypothetical protein [Candidatus Angelobacter sp.]
MKTDLIENAGGQVADIADKAREISTRVKDRWNDTYRDVERAARRAKLAAEEGVDDVRRGIKGHPIATVAAVAGGAFALGLLTGWIVGNRRH